MYQFFLDLLNDQVNGVGLGLSWMLIDIRFDLGKNVRSRKNVSLKVTSAPTWEAVVLSEAGVPAPTDWQVGDCHFLFCCRVALCSLAALPSLGRSSASSAGSWTNHHPSTPVIEHWYIRTCLDLDSPTLPPSRPPPATASQVGSGWCGCPSEVWTQPYKRHFGNLFPLGSETVPHWSIIK